MSRALRGLIAFALLSIGTATAGATEKILSFDSTITVGADGTLDVHDTIRVIAEGRNIRRGIYRDFPTTYPVDGGRVVTVGFGFDSATRDGNPEPWRVETVGNGVRIWLGSAQVMLPPGEHVYELNYHTDRQMGYFADHDELYWNVNGLGWNFSIDELTAHVILPAQIPRDRVTLEAYTGSGGERGKDFVAQLEGGEPVFRTTREMSPHEGMTIVVTWPKGFVNAEQRLRPPSAIASPGYNFASDGGGSAARIYGSPAEALLKRDLPHDSRPMIFGLLGVLLLLYYYWRVWDRVGRDPPGRVVIPEYEAPRDRSAAAMRYVVEMGYDDKCFSAAIVALAVKGCLRIEQDSGILGFNKKFSLVRESSPGPDPLSADESALLGALFKRGDRLELEQKNHSIVRGARSIHQAALDAAYKAGYFSINGGWHVLGVAISVLFIAMTVLQPGAVDPWPRWFLATPTGWFTDLCMLGCIAANIVFGRLLKAPTILGQSLMGHIRGFKMYLEVAEGEQLKRAGAPPPPRLTPQLYESYLPAALALGVEQAWGEKFTAVLNVEAPNYQPAWYSGSGWNAAHVAAFTSNFGSSLSSAISSASTAPGSHSGSSGGGSSGGGGGGGGGGGW